MILVFIFSVFFHAYFFCLLPTVLPSPLLARLFSIIFFLFLKVKLKQKGNNYQTDLKMWTFFIRMCERVIISLNQIIVNRARRELGKWTTFINRNSQCRSKLGTTITKRIITWQYMKHLVAKIGISSQVVHVSFPFTQRSIEAFSECYTQISMLWAKALPSLFRAIAGLWRNSNASSQSTT